MPYFFSGEKLFTATEVAKDVGVVRQTLWRWRRQGRIPLGRRYRDHEILYTCDELDSIRQFSNRLESPDVSSITGKHCKEPTERR
jgi:transposase-like protein